MPPVAPAPPLVPQLALVPAFPNLAFNQPVSLLQAPGDGSRWYLIEKAGRILVFDNDAAVQEFSVFADLSAQVNPAGEGGLLGMAFHPDFADNHWVFLSYTAGNFESRLAHFQADAAGLSLDESSETILITLDQPFTNHNGGHIAFGPGAAASGEYLYMGFGDGGGGGDPGNRAQDPFTFFGAILRIDVSAGTAYSVPQDNPFSDGLAASPEIFAYGFRNPWRFSFDREQGTLWLADVGQNAFEEVNTVVAGGNYGWRCYEGNVAFDTAGCPPEAQLEFPVSVYAHSGGGASVTGGHVYRGTLVNGLGGTYVFGDFITGAVRGLVPEEGGQYRLESLLESGLNIVSFAEDFSGELYVVDFSGSIYQIVAED